MAASTQGSDHFSLSASKAASRAARIIEESVLQQPVDLQELRNLALQPGGYQNNRLRVRVWPKLLNVNRYMIADFPQEIDPHRDDTQVQRDVDRSLWNIEPVKNWRDSYRDRRRKVLSDIIMAILCRNRDLYYYQGFHDLVSVFMLVLQDDHLAFAMSERVSRLFLSDFMEKDFERVSKVMHILLVIVKAADKQLGEHLQKARMEPFFATSWLLTWFSHDVKDFSVVARVFDAVLALPPVFIFYLSAAYVIYLRDFLLQEEADFATLHNVLSRAPEKYPFPADELISNAHHLMVLHPITKLRKSCNRDVAQMLTSKRVSLFSRAHARIRKVDSDWTILQSMRLTSQNEFPVAHRALHLLWSWGWNLTVLTVHADEVAPIEEEDDDDDNETDETGVKAHEAVEEKAVASQLDPALDTSFTFDPDDKDADNDRPPPDLIDLIDHVLFVVYSNSRGLWRTQKGLRGLLRIGAFWSITVAISSVLGYSYWNAQQKSVY